MKIIFGVKLILLFLLISIFVMNDKQKVDESITLVPESPTDSVVNLDELNVSIQELSSVIKWNRNPFLPYYDISSENTINIESFKKIIVPELNDIFYEDGKFTALLNDNIVSQGDSYLNMKVKYIGETIIILENENEETLTLKL